MHTVLIIDDEKSILHVLAIVLTKFGFNVETASDGLEGIKKFDECNFDVVITDICMLRHIRNSKRRSTPVIGISGTPWLLENNDFDAVLSKPASIKTLVDTVKNITQHHQEQYAPLQT